MKTQKKLKLIAEKLSLMWTSKEISDEDYESVVSPIFRLQNKLDIIEKKGKTEYTKKVIEDVSERYRLHDNLRRFFLADMLRRKSYLKGITLEQLDGLVQSINTLVSNLAHSINKAEIKINVKDEHNHSGSDFFRDVVLHNVLDIPIKYGGSERDFKNMLRSRWGVYDKLVDKI